ncbi:MAG: hypothetical protein KW793_03495 [Candidatus Doudnabacteria bacterium]|nr:hypothetical protein [Candidatus Doudnabacteria bacterium]
MNPPTVSYEQALTNLKSGGLTGNALANAVTSLNGAYSKYANSGVPSNQAPGGYTAPTNETSYGSLGTPQVPSSITGQNLQSSQPYNLPITKYPTSQAGLYGMIDATYQSQANANQGSIDKEKTSKDYLESLLGDTYGKLATKPQRTEEVYQQQGVDQAKQSLDQFNEQILSEKNALNHQRLAIFNAPGVTRGQAQQEYQETERFSLAKQADLSISQFVAQNRYSEAQSIADRKIQMEFEGYQQELDARKFFYGEHKDEYSKLEQRQYEAGIKRDETKLNLALDQAKVLQSTKLDILKDAQENGAPPNVLAAIQQAENPEAATAAAGNWLGYVDRLYKNAQIENLKSEAAKRNREGQIVNDPVSLSQSQGNIVQVSELLNSGGLTSAVGTSFLSRAPSGFWGSIGAIASVLGIPSFFNGAYKKLTGQHQNFISGVEQLRSNLNLDALIDAKARGATFGALSDQELKVLSSSATKIGTWALKDKSGNIIGYNASEKDFKNELDKVNRYAQLDYLLRGGRPEDVGATTLADGTIWVKNSDGTFTKLR